MKPDIITACHGTICTLQAETARARQWLAEHVADADPRLSIAVEYRFFFDIANGAIDDGLVVMDGASGLIAQRRFGVNGC